MSEINWKDRCWVTTVFLVREDKKVLLTWNNRMDTWIPIGGHIDPGETPEQAIFREVQEEAPGYEFKLVPESHYENNGDVKILKPYRFQIEKVPHHNIHMNFVFFGKCTEYTDAKENDEGDKLKWFSKDEIEKEEMIESVKSLALEAINVISF